MSELKSRWIDIFTTLKNANINVFSPGIHNGDCVEKYVVVKENGASKHAIYSTSIAYYSVMVYVPKNSYSELSPYVNEVKEKMKILYPMIIPTGIESPSFYDDSNKSHMISVEYKNHKKL